MLLCGSERTKKEAFFTLPSLLIYQANQIIKTSVFYYLQLNYDYKTLDKFLKKVYNVFITK